MPNPHVEPTGYVQLSETEQAIAARSLTIPSARALKSKEANAIKIGEKILQQTRDHRLKLESEISDEQAGSDYLSALDRRSVDLLTEIGLDAEYAWLDNIVKAIMHEAPFVQIDVLSHYAINCLNPDGSVDVSWDRLPPEEQAGVLLGAMFRSAFHGSHNFRIAALLDDFHLDHSERGIDDSFKFSNAQQNQYILEMARLFYIHGVILPGDVPGIHYVLTREKALHANVDRLIDSLNREGRGEVEVSDTGDVVFRPSPSLVRRLALSSDNRKREFGKNGISVIRNGQATCSALDSANHFNAVESDLIYLVLLDTRFVSQQDKTYALLRGAGVVTQDRYENIFFDSTKLSPLAITYGVCRLLESEIESQLKTLKMHHDLTLY